LLSGARLAVRAGPQQIIPSRPGTGLDGCPGRSPRLGALRSRSSAELSAVTSTPVADRPDVVGRMLGIDGWGATTAAALTHAAGDPVSLVAAALTAPEAVLA
jgi:hypothetical protein